MTKAPKEAPVYMNERQLELFDQAVAVSLVLMGLAGWRFERSKRKAKKGNLADVTINHQARMASCRLGDVGPDFKDSDVVSLAIHEVGHVRTCLLVNHVEYGIEGEALDSAEHDLIHVLEKLFLPMVLKQLQTSTQEAA
jgi:hypothetical protein